MQEAVALLRKKIAIFTSLLLTAASIKPQLKPSVSGSVKVPQYYSNPEIKKSKSKSLHKHSCSYTVLFLVEKVEQQSLRVVSTDGKAVTFLRREVLLLLT